MATPVIPFEQFLMAVPEERRADVATLHDQLSAKGYTYKIAEKASGYLVSYNHPATKNVLLNYVFRKSGILMRLYADEIGSYVDALQELPAAMKEKIAGSPNCRRLLDPGACNSRCKMGYTFPLDDLLHQKCRVNAFLLLMTDESTPYLLDLVQREVAARG